MARRSHRLDLHDPRVAAFCAERHLVTLTTLRADGGPHVVPVGATVDVEAGLVRVITSGSSVKARHIARGTDSRAAICQVDGRRWLTIEGTARLLTDPESIADAEARYAARYRTPRVNPERVVLAIAVERLLGNLPETS